jgi:hypothetical protein
VSLGKEEAAAGILSSTRYERRDARGSKTSDQGGTHGLDGIQERPEPLTHLFPHYPGPTTRPRKNTPSKAARRSTWCSRCVEAPISLEAAAAAGKMKCLASGLAEHPGGISWRKSCSVKLADIQDSNKAGCREASFSLSLQHARRRGCR